MRIRDIFLAGHTFHNYSELPTPNAHGEDAMGSPRVRRLKKLSSGLPSRLVCASLCACFVILLAVNSAPVWLPYYQHASVYFSLWPWPASPSSAETNKGGIRPGTFVYCVMGSGYPDERWLERAKWEAVNVVYIAWGLNISELSHKLASSKLKLEYYPNSTWTAGRNYQVRLVKDMEEQQGWKFEFLVYFDEDVVLNFHHFMPPPRQFLSLPGDHGPVRYLNHLLLHNRPMRAGVSYKDGLNTTLERATCYQRCHTDHNVVAIHRTAVDSLLPYSEKLDGENWWLSAYMSNLVAAATLPKQCAYFREVSVVKSAQTHGYYPRGQTRGSDIFVSAKSRVGPCLIAANITGFHDGMGPDKVFRRLAIALDPALTVFNEEHACVASKWGVDFARELPDVHTVSQCTL